jgi:hypothetical protein
MAGYGWPYNPAVRATQDPWNLEVNTVADILKKHKKVNDQNEHREMRNMQ